MELQSGAKGSVQLHRALDLLESLASSGSPRTLAELTEQVSIPKVTVHRLLSSLVDRGYVTQNPRTAAYSAGIRCFELGSLWAQNLGMRNVAAPHLADLNQGTGEMVHLAVYDAGDSVYVEKYESRHAVVAKSHVGRRCPAFCVAPGRVLLASQPAEEINDRLVGPLPTYTSQTITDPDELAQLLENVRHSGYATNYGSFRDGVCGVAAPIRDYTGQVVAFRPYKSEAKRA